MWKELANLIKKNEAALRSGRDLPYDKRVFPVIQLGQFRYTPVLMTGAMQEFPRVGVKSPIGALLQLPTTGFSEYSYPFYELVEGGSVPNSPIQQTLWDYSIMGFLIP